MYRGKTGTSEDSKKVFIGSHIKARVTTLSLLFEVFITRVDYVIYVSPVNTRKSSILTSSAVEVIL